MPNIGGLRESRRRLLSSVIHSILLYLVPMGTYMGPQSSLEPKERESFGFRPAPGWYSESVPISNSIARGYRNFGEDVKEWMARPNGEVFFHITQLLTGHECFNTFFHRMSLAPSPGCAQCGVHGEENEIEDNADHTFMHCEAFEEERERLIYQIGRFEPRDIVHRMLESHTQWKVVVEFADRVMLKKENEECELQKLEEGVH